LLEKAKVALGGTDHEYKQNNRQFSEPASSNESDKGEKLPRGFSARYAHYTFGFARLIYFCARFKSGAI
jgi:hypothetical protein